MIGAFALVLRAISQHPLGVRMSTAIHNGSGNGSVPAASPILVSVVIPAYQCSGYIAEAIRSVRAQSYPAHEILVVNDGSPDTEALEQALAQYMSVIRYIKQENGGPSSARNRGVRESRGNYVAFLDSDDLWFSNHLAKQVALFQEDPSLALVYSNSLSLEGDTPVGTAFEKHPQDLNVTFENLVAERCTVGTSTVVASRRAILESGGFEDRRRRSEDFDLWLRMAHRGFKMSYSSSVQVCHRAGNGLAEDDNVMKQSQIAVYEKALLTLPVTGPQAELICNKTQELQGRLQVEMTKESLRHQRFAEALESAKQAQKILPSTKTAVAVFGLKFFPRGMGAAYRMYERCLERKQNRRQVRFQSIEKSSDSKLGYEAFSEFAEK